MRFHIVIIFLVLSFCHFGQDQYSFKFKGNGKDVSKKENKIAVKQDSIILKQLRFYVSNVLFFYKGELKYKDNEVHLVELEKENVFYFSKEAEVVFDEITFDIGIDSITNVSGALGGDLDPTKGMYWSWQSGYINFKLEGYLNNKVEKNNFFQYHIGGYQAPFSPLQTVILPLKNKDQINIVFDLELFLSKIKLSKTNSIMRPCLESVELSKLIPQAIYLND